MSGFTTRKVSWCKDPGPDKGASPSLDPSSDDLPLIPCNVYETKPGSSSGQGDDLRTYLFPRHCMSYNLSVQESVGQRLWLIQRWGVVSNCPNRDSSLVIQWGTSVTPPVYFFLVNLFGKMLYFSVKRGDYSLTSWQEFSVIIHWRNTTFKVNTLKTCSLTSPHVYTYNKNDRIETRIY
jgi:hypothetical protein